MHPGQLCLDQWRSVMSILDPKCSLYGFIFLTNRLMLYFLLQRVVTMLLKINVGGGGYVQIWTSLESISPSKALLGKELGHPLTTSKRSLPSWWHFNVFVPHEMFMKRKTVIQEKLHKPQWKPVLSYVISYSHTFLRNTNRLFGNFLKVSLAMAFFLKAV